ncbi:acetyl-CoA C-acetyltransferase [Comamonas thiooxydans]|uniref:acetyl-CoA C-acetyltransferase n=1 Tax=Comamonas thiooxydans TaxID=363952 RepID=UPI0005F79774|nr:acetyl-CoA C-acetyltransferase [Comamonas thiooxydans]MCO8250407.1 acetyl-CoA C-acetyltransferase [Comamonas thiooxydans]UBQ43209.1 acetyl-CoA C-acetyltransferase [Comamonas thiooxydans]CUB00116.1 acetyl-CoA acetyltransferases [Comamonas thiooxydans]
MEALIFDHVRTPRGKGKPDGALHEVTPVWLAAQPLVALRERNRLDTAVVDDVIMGCVVPVGEQGGNVGRMAVLQADYAQSVAGVQLNRYCGSGLEAVSFAAAKVMAGQADMTIGAGVEMMSRVPMGSDGGAWAQDPQLASKTYFVMQGISADLLASLRGHSRRDLDEYSAESHRRAAKAWAEGRFDQSVVPVKDFLGMTLLEKDETIRAETTADSLAALKPAFTEMGQKYGYDSVALQRYPQVEQIHHHHHAGNSSGIVDGAAAVLIGTAEAGARQGMKPRARIRAFASIGSEPTLMLDGPAHAARKALARARMQASDIDLWELNEAFATVVLTMMEELDIPHERMNVNGGAIAMGHPLGATGAMILGTVLDELERSGKRTALISLCVAAGMGSAMIIERV